MIVDRRKFMKPKRKYGKYLFTIAFMIAIVIIMGLIERAKEQDEFQNRVAKEVVRLHIRACSNEKKDQENKLVVRNRVAAYLRPVIARAKTKEEAKELMEESLPEVVRVSEETLRALGDSHSVSAYIREEEFPEKMYGDLTFPAGVYDALVVNIGPGEGRNWWCCMYPSLCFVGSVYEENEEGELQLKQNLQGKDYETLKTGGQVEYRSYFWEKVTSWIR